MLKEFRRQFIRQTMILVGVVLLITFAAIGSIIVRNEYAELKNTMSIMLKPWKASDGESRSNDRKAKAEAAAEPKVTPDDSTAGTDDSTPESKERPVPKSDKNRPADKDPAPAAPEPSTKRTHNDSIATIFYYPNEDRTTVISESIALDDVETVVRDILAQPDDFGTLSEHHIIYYREKSADVTKLAITDVSYLLSRMLRTLLILLLAYVLSMGLLLVISFRLAAIAQKPLQKAFDRERKFVADISHDLKTPITVIMANNSILRSNPEARIADNLQWLESTDRASEDMMHLIANMLTLSALDSPQQPVVTTPVNLTSAAERCLLQLESVAYEKEVTLEESIEEGLTVAATEEYVKRICSCLLENAVKYEPSGGKVMTKAYRHKRHVYFVVQNQNSRIADQDLPHIFDRFYRGDQTRNQTKGHGLGLPIIKQMAALCGADMQVVSTDKDGTIFTVIFQTS